ncbi:hypothetical protein [Lentzea sp. NBRC 102530]|uniref:hypothetical protein n=1 Tax=Lentzea sp. NBRC 102530 TaxID=3032201 RepID=UPI0024A2407C|nr:hypothetical protein [Lentzea sp. NBRC 102530]GLY53889.1 hypothetical protein Lesp01_75450 [Lentzea sp. NBRC 102530]
MRAIAAEAGVSELISDEGEHAMRANCLAVVEALVATGEVREEFDVVAVADVLVTMCSPHVHQVLGWPADRCRDWLADTLEASLLRPVRAP